jgi:hypothetical protein
MDRALFKEGEDEQSLMRLAEVMHKFCIISRGGP